MKKRWLYYFLVGLIFGAIYWHYLGKLALFFNGWDMALSHLLGVETEKTWFLLLPIVLFAYFGVWLIPAVLPGIFEFRHSTSLRLSALAVVIVWISAVLGYYVNYIVMLAFVGLPHMEYLVVIGQRTSTLWQDWSTIFPKLILYKFVKWVIVGVLVGGIAGLITGKTYSSLLKNNLKISSLKLC